MHQPEEVLQHDGGHEGEDPGVCAGAPHAELRADRGHKNALNIPDELTLDHIWKDKKREYNFDAVFAPDASQDKVRSSVLLKVRRMPLVTCYVAWKPSDALGSLFMRTWVDDGS